MEMGKLRIVKTANVMAFSTEKSKGKYASRLLLEQEGVGSDKLMLVHVTIKAGAASGTGHVHPAPYDEAYYILKDEALIEFEEGRDSHRIGPDTAVFIPGGTWHRVANPGTEDLVLLTIWPQMPLQEGINDVSDLRKRARGKNFRLVEPDQS
jgi:mannose-6-phosphate isomerase-like protein (cupin superfamily)